jgi:hypothetical protein
MIYILKDSLTVLKNISFYLLDDHLLSLGEHQVQCLTSPLSVSVSEQVQRVPELLSFQVPVVQRQQQQQQQES